MFCRFESRGNEGQYRPRKRVGQRVNLEHVRGALTPSAHADGTDPAHHVYSSLSAHNDARRKRSALAITETELKLIAAAASTGLKSKPKNG